MNATLDRLASVGLAPEPPLPPPPGASAPAVLERGRAVLAALGVGDPQALPAALPAGFHFEPGIAALLCALATAEPADAREAGLLLTGLGPGLTPLGDDLLTGAAAAMTTLGVTAGLSPEVTRRWAVELVSAAREKRTTALSARLLELAAEGWAIPPLRDLLDLGAEHWTAALAALERVGATSGRACALAAGAACAQLGGQTRLRQQRSAKAGKPAPTVGIFPMTSAVDRPDTGLVVEPAERGRSTPA